MHFHFAYPNVLPKKQLFIGCGRYTVFPEDEVVEDGYHEVIGAPNTPNNTTLKRAVQLLAPESFDSGMAIYHKQDQEGATYQGDSLDLAWFLTHVFRGRTLRCSPSTDVWCTGVIQINGSPVLLDVDQTGFDLKLQAFLDADNPDEHFIIPLANLNPAAKTLCKKNNVEIVRLGSGAACSLGCKGKKRLFAIPANGLQELLDLLFTAQDIPVKKRNLTRTVLLFLVLVAVSAIAAKPYLLPLLNDGEIFHNPPPLPIPPQLPVFHLEKLQQQIEQGDFSSVQLFLNSDAGILDKELTHFKEQLIHPVQVDAEMEYQKENGVSGRVEIDNNNGMDRPVLTYRDYYRLHVRIANPPDSMYLYLFQVDSSGNLTAIFPSDQFNAKNPLRPWQWPLDIPAGKNWIFLDRLTGKSPTQTREILYLLASPWPARDIEELNDTLHSQTEDDQVKAKLLARLALRQQGEIPSIHCIRWIFYHAQ